MSVEGTEILGKMNIYENVITNNVVKIINPKMIILRQEM